MIEFYIFLKGVGIGTAIAASGLGPMSLLCMRRTLVAGWRHGLAVGAGITIGDAIYGTVAALGLAGVSRFMLAHGKPLHLAAGLFLIYLGLRGLRTVPPMTGQTADASARAWTRGLIGAILLTLTNPPTIIMFAALFTSLAPTGGLSLDAALATVAGVFLGSLLWWCILTTVVGSLRHVIGQRVRTWISRITGQCSPDSVSSKCAGLSMRRSQIWIEPGFP
jgi:threonine/homoserine/homoserine lactone efflux protein